MTIRVENRLENPPRLAHTLLTINPTVSPPPAAPDASSGGDHTRWFAEEVQPHEPALRAYLRRKYPACSDVDDVVQESFLKAFLARKRGRLTSVKGFLFHVARNAAVSFFRKRKFISVTPVNDLGGLRVLEGDADVVETVCSQDELNVISEAIAELPDRCREIFMLRLMRGMDYGAIARQLAVSESTVRVHIARGMKKCGEFLRARGVIEGGAAMTPQGQPSPLRRESPCGEIDDIAADWLARREGGFTAEEQDEFSEWLLADARHAAAVKQIDGAWRFMQRPRFTGQAANVLENVERQVEARNRVRRFRRVGLSLGGLAAAAAVAIALLPGRMRDAAETPAIAGSVEVKPERQTLADGSVVDLNAGAEITLHFTPRQRDVRLMRGEVHFAVAKDASRPFVVTAGSVSVRAVGTEFAVRFAPAEVDVLVTEGRVAVERIEPLPAAAVAAPHSAEPTYLNAGNRAIVPIAAPAASPLQVQPVASGQIQSALAWRGMRVEFTATPLADIVARLNRHNRVQLELGDAGLDDIRISGIFWLDDPEGFSRLVEVSAGLKAKREAGGRIVLTRR